MLRSITLLSPKHTYRPSVHARGSIKYSKARFDLDEVLRKDRERIELLRSSGWRARLGSLKVYPWKFFIAFMICWSFLGLRVVPYIKNIRAEGVLPNGKYEALPPEIRSNIEKNSPPR